jgi:hypothetical protein
MGAFYLRHLILGLNIPGNINVVELLIQLQNTLPHAGCGIYHIGQKLGLQNMSNRKKAQNNSEFAVKSSYQ